MEVKYVTDVEAKASIGSGSKLLYIGAEWCGPCKMMKEQLEGIKDDIEILKVDVDAHKEYAKELGVSSLPTMFVYKDGKVTKQFVGFTPKEVIKEAI